MQFVPLLHSNCSDTSFTRHVPAPQVEYSAEKAGRYRYKYSDAEKSRVLRAEEVAAEREREVEWLRSELATAQAQAPSDTEVAQQRRSSRLADIDSLV